MVQLSVNMDRCMEGSEESDHLASLFERLVSPQKVCHPLSVNWIEFHLKKTGKICPVSSVIIWSDPVHRFSRRYTSICIRGELK
jgi:hypothetical protein